jgi:hypothetical protein
LIGIALGDEGCALCAACPWHYGVFFACGCDDTFDEAFVGFHDSDPRFVFLWALMPLLEDEYDGAIGPVFGNQQFFQEKYGDGVGDL